jgi:NAD(P)-dependent dehydrogenase (short-subunit alcohol dehydrogenase family)
MELDGKAVVITGGVGGIGAALASAFGAADSTVLTADLPDTGVDLELDGTGTRPATAPAVTARRRITPPGRP